MIVKTDAVVLKSMRFRESSKIVTFYTRKFGKLAAVAKGARDSKSKFGASLEPMTEVALVLYKKEQRDLQLVSQCDILRPHKNLHNTIVKMAAAMAIVELLYQLTHSEEENPALYALLAESLKVLEQSSGNVQNLVSAFQIRFASLFGYTPVFDRCGECGKPYRKEQSSGTVTFRVDRGCLVCSNCLRSASQTAGGRKIGGGPESFQSFLSLQGSTVGMLSHFLSSPLDSLPVLEYENSVGNELNETLRSYLRYHFEELRPLKSAEVFRAMLVPEKSE